MGVVVEFYGVPRLKAGRETLAVNDGTVAEVLAAVERVCPSLEIVNEQQRRLNAHYLLSINGHGFVNNIDSSLKAGDRLLILSADVGG